MLVLFPAKNQTNPVNMVVIEKMVITYTNIKNPSDLKIPE